MIKEKDLAPCDTTRRHWVVGRSKTELWSADQRCLLHQNKKDTNLVSFLFCIKRDKGYLNIGNCEQKVSEITTSIPALSAVAIWEMYPLFRYNDTNCHKAFFHCDKFRLDLL